MKKKCYICEYCGAILTAKLNQYIYYGYGKDVFLCPVCKTELNIYKEYYITLTLIKKDRQLTMKDCKCTIKKTCKFHKECIGDSCAPGINICDNPKHQENPYG